MQLLFACLLTALTSVAGETVVHCADTAGRIIALAADGGYRVKPPNDGPPSGTNPEKWTFVQQNAPPAGGVASNSFTGSYMQVLPDDRDSYHAIMGSGSFTMTGLEFHLRVFEPGLHTLFMRWTGGDSVGGGDSVYAVMYHAESGDIAPGRSTYTPLLVGLEENPGQFAGCCYTPITHACPCFEAGTVPADGPPDCQRPNGFWLAAGSGPHGRAGMMCEVGHGQLEKVDAPRWYLFAGQQYGNVMDFDSEPWDATCEAEGTGTADTGLDLAQWDLAVGDYRIVIYPREDGSAFDALYLTTSQNAEPPNGLRLELGASTTSGCGDAAPVPRVSPGPQNAPSGDGSSGNGGGGGMSVLTVLLLLIFMAQLGAAGVWLYRLHRAGKPMPWAVEVTRTLPDRSLASADGLGSVPGSA